MVKELSVEKKPLRNVKEDFVNRHASYRHGVLIVNPFLKSARFESIYEALREGFLAHSLELHLLSYSEILSPLGKPIELPRDVEFALFWDKDISLARQLEMQGVKVFNSSSSIENADSKIKTALLLEEHHLPTPKTLLGPLTFPQCGYNDFSFLSRIEKEIEYPYVLKEEFGSFGEQVRLIHDRNEAIEVIKNLGTKRFLIQEFIKESAGSDIRVVVIGEEVVCAYKRTSLNDFRSNLALGGESEPIRLNEPTIELARKATSALGLDFAGVDILESSRGNLICEVNSSPQFLGAKLATGVDVAERLASYIASKL